MRARCVPVLAVVTAVACPVVARADQASCTRTLARAVGRYLKKRSGIIARCEAKRARGSLPATAVCRPQCDAGADNAGAPCRDDSDCLGSGAQCLVVSDGPTGERLARAAARAQRAIASACGGLPSLPPVGPPCDASATDAASLAACVTAAVQDGDVATANADTLAATVHAAPVPVTDRGLRKCQAAVGKVARRYMVARYKALQKCNERVARGRITGPCPDADTAAKLAAARARLEAGLRRKCSEAQLAADTPPKLDFGFPCEAYKAVTFVRDDATNNNTVPVLDRFAGCIADATAIVADRMLSIAYPGAEGSAFAEGVAAGDATDTAVVFWTRLPDSTAGAFLDISTDPTFASGVQTVNVPPPNPGDDGTVKPEVTLLAPATTYYYRFRQGTETSRTGRVRTAPDPQDAVALLAGWSGDANAFFRPYTVLDPVRLAEPDAWFFIGDTIYADDPRADGLVASTLEDYYAKYRENRRDAALRNLLASTGTYVQWDDHEVRNDFSGAVPAFAAKLAAGNAAFRRYYPLREFQSEPMRLYRSFRWGKLAEFFLIDVRQYRSAKYTCCNDPNEDGFVLTDTDTTCTVSGEATLPSPACTAALADPSRTVLGAAQKAWLENALASSTATFKFIMNGPPITQLSFVPYDRWDGYPAERTEILDFIVNNGIQNVIWLSTDLHGLVISAERVDINPATTHALPEVVAGAIGMDTIFRELPPTVAVLLPSLPALLTQVTQFAIDRFNAALLSVEPGPPATARLDFYDRSGAVIQSVSFTATP